MNTSSATAEFYGVLEMEHLVIDDVLDRRPRHARMVKDTAHHDRVMGGVIVAKMVAGPLATPCHSGTCQQSVKEPNVQILKHNFQIIGVALGRSEALPSAHLADQVSLLTDAVAGDIASVPCRGVAVDWTPV